MSKKISQADAQGRRKRAEIANRMLKALADVGMTGCSNPEDGQIGRFLVDSRNRVWYWDPISRIRTFANASWPWHGFKGDEDLGRIVLLLSEYCNKGESISQELTSALVQAGVLTVFTTSTEEPIQEGSDEPVP